MSCGEEAGQDGGREGTPRSEVPAQLYAGLRIEVLGVVGSHVRSPPASHPVSCQSRTGSEGLPPAYLSFLILLPYPGPVREKAGNRGSGGHPSQSRASCPTLTIRLRSFSGTSSIIVTTSVCFW